MIKLYLFIIALMKWVLFTAILASTLTYSFFNRPADNASKTVDKFMDNIPSLPRYMEGGYNPLGRSPVVDNLLKDPLYAPVYAEKVADTIKKQTHLFSLSEALFKAADIPLESSPQISISIANPFKEAFPEKIADKLHQYWSSFIQIHQEVENLFSVLTADEKEWIKLHHNKFFFGEDDKGIKYDFFTSDNPYPFKFFELASKLDLAQLTECAKRLNKIADDFYLARDDFASIDLKDDFIWEEKGLKIVISKKTDAHHNGDADFFIDLGGHNSIANNAGGTSAKRSLALHLDLKGHNTYSGKDYVQGSGFLGIGLLYSCAGGNSYTADSYSQGCGLFGIGTLVNREGSNRFVLNFGGQSFALFGASLLWNMQGKNDYYANQGMAQAATSTMGVAFLVDNEGGNSYSLGQPKSSGTTRFGGIGQGGSSGFRYSPWLNNPSLYGGLSFLYVGGGDNRFKAVWLAQGSAYFLGAGILVAEGSNDTFDAEYDAQGQGLHLAFGLLLKKGSHNRFNGGWGSLGVGGDRSVGMFIGIGEDNHYEGTDQSIGSSRKPKALGMFINIGSNNSYTFQKISNARIEFPQTPREWSQALFIEAGNKSTYSPNIDEFKRGDNLEWGIENHSLGTSTKTLTKEEIFSKFHTAPPLASKTFFKPLIQNTDFESANYENRRQIYEKLDVARFKDRKRDADLNFVLKTPAKYDEDLLNYAILWALRNKDKADLSGLKNALANQTISSGYSRKMAASLIGTFFKNDTVQILDKLLKEDSSEDVRYYAALSLTFHLSPETYNIIKRHINDPSEIVRFAIAKGLQENPNPQASELITPLFKDESFYVRRAAGLSAISLGNKAGIEVVLETLQFDSLDTTYNYGDNIYAQLSSYLGVDNGLDKKAWIDWWDKVKDSYQFPSKKKNSNL